MTGTVTKQLPDKGFGFLRADDGQEYFFHRDACGGEFLHMREGTMVDFEPGPPSAKGPRAEHVRKL